MLISSLRRLRATLRKEKESIYCMIQYHIIRLYHTVRLICQTVNDVAFVYSPPVFDQYLGNVYVLCMIRPLLIKMTDVIETIIT